MTATVTLPTDLPTDENDNTVLTTREMAELAGMTPRRLRRLFRKAGVGCGQGSMYVATVEDVPAMLARIGN
jgi:hypothetical protein